MKSIVSRLLVVVLLLLVVAACSSTGTQQYPSGTARNPEYYRLYGPGSEQPPDYGTHSGE